MITYPSVSLRTCRRLLRLTKGRGAQTLARLDSFLVRTKRRAHLANGVMIELAPDPHLFGYLIQIHERHVRDWIMEHAPSASTFVDVGANVGYFAGWAIATLPKGSHLSLLEPDPDNFAATAWTEAEASRRGIHLHRLQTAVTDEGGEMFLHRHPRYCTYHHVSRTEEGASFRVPAVTLTEYLDSQGIEHLDCLKVDVEGHEAAVLRGAADLFAVRRIRHALIEVRPKGGSELAFELGRSANYAMQYWQGERWHAWTDIGQVKRQSDVRLDVRPE